MLELHATPALEALAADLDGDWEASRLECLPFPIAYTLLRLRRSDYEWELLLKDMPNILLKYVAIVGAADYLASSEPDFDVNEELQQLALNMSLDHRRRREDGRGDSAEALGAPFRSVGRRRSAGLSAAPRGRTARRPLPAHQRRGHQRVLRPQVSAPTSRASPGEPDSRSRGRQPWMRRRPYSCTSKASPSSLPLVSGS